MTKKKTIRLELSSYWHDHKDEKDVHQEVAVSHHPQVRINAKVKGDRTGIHH